MKPRKKKEIKAKPDCFDTERDWQGWQEHFTSSGGNIDRYCVDCTAQRQSLMIQQHRCAFPGTIFYSVNGASVGIMPDMNAKVKGVDYD